MNAFFPTIIQRNQTFISSLGEIQNECFPLSSIVVFLMELTITVDGRYRETKLPKISIYAASLLLLRTFEKEKKL